MFRRSIFGLLATIGEQPHLAQSNAVGLLQVHDAVDLVRQVGSIADEIITAVTASGWSPTDLAEVLRRRVAHCLPTLRTLLDRHAAGFAPERVPPTWRAELHALPASAPPVGVGDVADLTRLLTVAGVLSVLPEIAPIVEAPGTVPSTTRPSAPTQAGPEDARKLARVRALLAKAESTDYEAEAEALTAKAQELVTRYALQRLLDRVDEGERRTADRIGARRIWIDAPYVEAKASLLAAVATANRCRAVLSVDLGFLTVVGEPGDLDVVDLLGTSLLLQANTAMLRQGTQVDRAGRSRTRSFRQSFLLSYAVRIGERLRAVETATVAESEQPDRLLPVLHATQRAVDEHTEHLFPRMQHNRGSRTIDTRGWAAGRAAADLAQLDVDGRLTATA